MIETVKMIAKPVVEKMKGEIAERVKRLKEEGVKPKIVALMIGDNPESWTYVNLKMKNCAEVGIESDVIDLRAHSKDKMPEVVAETLSKLNNDPSVNAVLPQLPFDGKISEEFVFSRLSPAKDVDGLTPHNLGKLFRGEYTLENSLIPCTPKGIVLLAQHYGVHIAGSEAAIIGRSTLVGKPLQKLLQDLDATATCYHTKSRRVLERVKDADIVVSASGKPPEVYGQNGFRLTGKMVKEESAVFGVGVWQNPKTNERFFDVDTFSLEGKCAYLTPNVGGVGPMTRICLLQNTLIATMNQRKKERSN